MSQVRCGVLLAFLANLTFAAKADEVSWPAVVLDPGHGGETPGITAADGRPEKDLTWRLAQDLGQRLQQANPALRIFFTRQENETPTRKGRADAANARRPALFISLHGSAGESGEGNAAAVFYPAASAETAEGKLFLPVGRSADLYAAASRRLADALCRRLATLEETPCRRAQAEGLPLLDGLMMPAAVVEIGNLRHPALAASIGAANQPAYRTLVEALAEGIADDLEKPREVAPER